MLEALAREAVAPHSSPLLFLVDTEIASITINTEAGNSECDLLCFRGDELSEELGHFLNIPCEANPQFDLAPFLKSVRPHIHVLSIASVEHKALRESSWISDDPILDLDCGDLFLLLPFMRVGSHGQDHFLLIVQPS